MSLVKVKHKAQITLPANLRKALGIEEGDYLNIEIEHNKVTLTPQTIMDKISPITLSIKGEQMLNEALEDVKAGKVKEFKSVNELLKDLHK
jgi:AbrB family looped-hinge helix DNA binding protein